MNYKILTRWYCVLALFQKYFSSVPNIYWHCSIAVGNMTNIWLDCLSLKEFWTAVFKDIQEDTDVSIAATHEAAFLFIFKTPIHKYKESPLRQLCQAAKIAIPWCWRSPDHSTIED